MCSGRGWCWRSPKVEAKGSSNIAWHFPADDHARESALRRTRDPGLDSQHKGKQTANRNVSDTGPGASENHSRSRRRQHALVVSQDGRCSGPEQIHRSSDLDPSARVKPHRLEGYMASNDPQFEEEAADIIALYINPPQHAAVF